MLVWSYPITQDSQGVSKLTIIYDSLLAAILITGVYLSLNGTFLPNGSIIAYTKISTDIGEDTGSRSLVCNTDKIGCCETEGYWYLANGSVIIEDSQEFSVIRNHGTVILFRNDTIISLLSTLCCRLPDASNTNQTVCVNSG